MGLTVLFAAMNARRGIHFAGYRNAPSPLETFLVCLEKFAVSPKVPVSRDKIAVAKIRNTVLAQQVSSTILSVPFPFSTDPKAPETFCAQINLIFPIRANGRLNGRTPRERTHTGAMVSS